MILHRDGSGFNAASGFEPYPLPESMAIKRARLRRRFDRDAQ
jgi:hypothetical protein